MFLGKLEMKERQLGKIREKQILSESLRQTEFLPHILVEIFVKGLPTDLGAGRVKGTIEGGVQRKSSFFWAIVQGDLLHNGGEGRMPSRRWLAALHPQAGSKGR